MWTRKIEHASILTCLPVLSVTFRTSFTETIVITFDCCAFLHLKWLHIAKKNLVLELALWPSAPTDQQHIPYSTPSLSWTRDFWTPPHIDTPHRLLIHSSKQQTYLHMHKCIKCMCVVCTLWVPHHCWGRNLSVTQNHKLHVKGKTNIKLDIL